MAVAVPGCRKREGEPRMRYAGQVAYGRPDTCPDDDVDPNPDSMPGPMDLRCSYADTTGGPITRVRGRVLLEGPPGSPGDPPGRTEVIVHEAPPAIGGPLGREVARATTDPQGAFSIGATLRAGEYEVVVPGAGGRTLARRRISVGGDAGHRLDEVRLVIPRPMDELD
ncbi:MAG: hypothetical protein H6712_20925 [Myxococcales bacterium]|nr:hypothetical protein [Myxococcales bacterium]MCB9716338.1 hypothetical protein [Myxococcales bacterium]